MQMTAVFMSCPEGYIGFVEVLPGANTQGSTLEETRANRKEATRSESLTRRTLDRRSGGIT